MLVDAPPIRKNGSPLKQKKQKKKGRKKERKEQVKGLMDTDCGVLASVVADDAAPSRVPASPAGDVVHLALDDEPLVLCVTVALHIAPAVHLQLHKVTNIRLCKKINNKIK